jgi:metal-responsive CopG/Arc/MetJ family transcriptional regulator
MAEAESPPEKTTVNIRITETFLEDVDATWEDQGFNSRSEFIRTVLRDALKHPEFNRADLKAMLAGEVEIREGRTHSSDEVKAAYGLDDTARDSDE